RRCSAFPLRRSASPKERTATQSAGQSGISQAAGEKSRRVLAIGRARKLQEDVLVPVGDNLDGCLFLRTVPPDIQLVRARGQADEKKRAFARRVEHGITL